jgi:flavin reductase (DIM6/NTAB) family NADH-FMN oxidoreductase RutF
MTSSFILDVVLLPSKLSCILHHFFVDNTYIMAGFLLYRRPYAKYFIPSYNNVPKVYAKAFSRLHSSQKGASYMGHMIGPTLMLSANGAKSVWTSQCRKLSNHVPEKLTQQLRALLRETAQPVAVVTALMPRSSLPRTVGSASSYHGATLSSFTSIAMHPVPIVSFSLKVPSRMATALNTAPAHLPSHMVINLLCAAQAPAAVRFARPDLYPDPFASSLFSLTEDDLPVLTGSLGAVSCKMMGNSWPLRDLEFANKLGERMARMGGKAEVDDKGMASELFIARVIRVERVRPIPQADELHCLPLLYHRRVYATSRPLPERRDTSPP